MVELLERLRATLQAFPAVRLAAAFGSVARGSGHAPRDGGRGLPLDPDTRELRQKIEADLGRAAGREVDLVFLDTAPPLLRFEIASDGVLLLASPRDDWGSFPAR